MPSTTGYSKQQLEASLGSKQTDLISQDRNLQDRNPRNHKTLLAYFYISINPRSKKYKTFHLNSQPHQFQQFPLVPTDSSPRVPKGIETRSTIQVCKNLPLSRRLVAHSLMSENLPTTYLDPLGPVQNFGWMVNLNKLELIPQQVFNFVGFHFELSQGLVKSTEWRWQALTRKIQIIFSKTVHVPNRSPKTTENRSHKGFFI